MARIIGKAYESLVSICRDVISKHPTKDAGLSKTRIMWGNGAVLIEREDSDTGEYKPYMIITAD